MKFSDYLIANKIQMMPSVFFNQMIEALDQVALPVITFVRKNGYGHFSFSTSWETCFSITLKDEEVYWHFYSGDKAYGDYCLTSAELPEKLQKHIQFYGSQ